MKDIEQRWDISSKTGKGVVGGRCTEIAVTEFRNKYFIIITDCGKIGSMVQVQMENSSGETICNSKVLFGIDKPEVLAVASSLAEICKFRKTVVFGLSLKLYSGQTVKELKDLLIEVIGAEQST
ncbi:uncharacterized protein TNIN_227111 [Trichonephila inaurata madagascariensis]|uniref:Proteasome assembly chaperone 3 n=1 Tax=Trichonephila inaurata madagascariensis TaxID=2747483 RepID=A0A8X6WMF3_9ARAC|nr:uncharacterized protein TNIN_227111 [Trichonephila inaurata madagascariensis]